MDGWCGDCGCISGTGGDGEFVNNWEYFIGGILPAGGWILERSVNAMVITKAEVQARVSPEMGWDGKL